jgi:1,2-dihydroxy-3-keto-5-methylthiopentene dioxygenase
MAILSVPDKRLVFKEETEIKAYLEKIGIRYERWDADEMRVSPEASEEEILYAYKAEIERLKAENNYVKADVINILPTTPGLEEMLNKFNKEHWHDEDEVRFIIKGNGLFHIAPKNSDVVSIQMQPGDLICVPSGTLHWFNLCEDKTVRAIRLFQDSSGWKPHYTNSSIEERYQPLCFGPLYIPSAAI